MNGASKILTVSYGTFSCTLEGFDEPFNTMKAIAEYFRDLAADDRYFGAEPPTPDAAMLHKIAEREIQRRVESKISDNGVILRAEDAAPPRIIMPAARTPAAAPSLATVADSAPAVESAAARLSRLRAAQTQILAPAAPALGDISSRFTDVVAYAEDQDAQPAATAVATPPVAAPPVATAPQVNLTEPEAWTAPVVETVLAEPEAVASAPEPVTAPEPLTAIDSVFPEAAAAVNVAELIAEADQPAAVPAPEAGAEAAIVAQSETATADEVLASLRETLAGLIVQDDQLAEDMSAAHDATPDVLFSDDALPEDLPETLPESLGDTFEPDEQIENFDQAGLDDLTRLDGDIAADLARIDDDAYLGADDEGAAVPPDAAELIAEADHPAAMPAPVAAPDIAVAAEARTPAPSPQAATDDQPGVTVTSAAPVVAEKIQRARARVIKIRRLDKKSEAETLTPDAEADLQNTLAALEAEIAPTPAAGPAPAPAPAALRDTSVEALLDAELGAAVAAPAETVSAEPVAAEPVVAEPLAAEQSDPSGDPRISATDDAAVDRLLARTNTQLEVPEVKRRRSAIAHLKAAVLATVADRKTNPNAASSGAAVKMDPYRKDLDQAVRPAVPAERPAPLVLVSAQRIDRKRDAAADANRPMPQIVPSVPAPQQPATKQPATGAPVRPRRVTASGLSPVAPPRPADDRESDLTPDAMNNIFAGSDKQSFSDFADSLGADSLAELIEAAGAYCTLVLDQPSFTRPMLFQQLSGVPRLAEINREEGLRGFGKLLRDGRIQKTVRGQFALSTTSPILTEAKRIAS